MKLAALISGGKDSMLAIKRMQEDGHEIKYLLTMETKSAESYMFHHSNIWVTELISESMDLPLIKGLTQGRKEEELDDLRELIKNISPEVDGIITGALASLYQKSRIDGLCSELGIESITPLWGIDPKEMWNEILDKSFRVMITAVSADGLKKEWLGKIIDQKKLIELEKLSKKYRFHLGFEGGEAETLVLNMPLYNKPIKILKSETIWEESSGVFNILKASLEV